MAQLAHRPLLSLAQSDRNGHVTFLRALRRFRQDVVRDRCCSRANRKKSQGKSCGRSGSYRWQSWNRNLSGVLAAERLARNVGMPVYERAVGILLPRPDMQRVERWEPEAIRSFEQVKELSHELRRSRMRRIPHVGENQIVGADQSQASV